MPWRPQPLQLVFAGFVPLTRTRPSSTAHRWAMHLPIRRRPLEDVRFTGR
jgi:hypothetical protein